MIGAEKSRTTEHKELLEQGRLIFIEIKANYSEFLSSLRYQNLNDKKRNKLLRKRMEDVSGFDNWEVNINKDFRFQEELMSENKGFACFLKLLENIKRIEWINNQLATSIFLQEKALPGQQQARATAQTLEHIEKSLLTFLQPYPHPPQK